MPDQNQTLALFNAPLEVIVIHPSYGDKQGGIINAGLSYVKGLLAQSHFVEVWTASRFMAEQASALGVPVIYDPRLRSWKSILLHPELRRIFHRAQARPDIVILHNTGHLWPLVWLLGQPRRHAVVYHNRKIRGRGYFRHWLAIATTQRDRLMHAARWRPWVLSVQTIKNGAAPPRERFPERSVNGPVAIGALAEFRPEKNMSLLVTAAAALEAQGFDFKILAGGDGEQLDAVQRMANERGVAHRFTWLGWVTDIDAFFSCIDVFALPSLNEPFGLVVLEALQRGKPVVATRTDGPTDILAASPPIGWLVEVGDAAAFTTALAEAIASAEERSARGRAARSHAAKYYSDEVVGRSLSGALKVIQAG